MANPLVSTIIPAFNAEKTICRALSSVLDQTYRPLEVIVVDDGSTDGTAGVVERCTAEITSGKDATSITLLYQYQKNSGPSKARNNGIRAASGDYVAFLDADDSWTDDKIAKQVDLFSKDPSIDIVFCNAGVAKIKDGKTGKFTTFERHGLDTDFWGHDYLVVNAPVKLLRVNFMLTPAVMLKKSCFADGLLFSENRRYAEDWELWLKMSLRYKFGYIHEVCVHVRDEGDGLCSHDDQMLMASIDVMEKFISQNREYLSGKISPKDLSMLVKETYKWAGYHFMMQDKSKLARNFYKRSLRERFDVKTLFYLIRTSLS
jgi:glycosyltransferase involved in cell wall biosynthesis